MIGPVRWGPFDARTPIEVSRVSVRCDRLPEAFDGFRVALVADLHFGRWVRDGFVRRVFRLVRSQQPDLILLAGDMVNRAKPFAARLAEVLSEPARTTCTCAILGNHERYTDVARFREALAADGVDVLVNAHRTVRRGAAKIALAGVDEIRRGRPDFRAAMDGIEPGTFTLLAGHQPDLADMVPAGLGVDMMVSGHTHGGQVRLFGRAPIRKTKNRNYLSGLTGGPGFPLYISRGLGAVKMPLRVGCDPELPIITLRRGPTGHARGQLPVER